MRVMALAFACTCALALAGCGDSDKGDGDADHAEKVARQFWAAANRGDGKAVCAVSKPKFQTGNPCKPSMHNLDNLRGKLNKSTAEKVSTRGGKEAIVTLRYPEWDVEAYLQKAGGKWKVAEFNAYGRRSTKGR